MTASRAVGGADLGAPGGRAAGDRGSRRFPRSATRHDPAGAHEGHAREAMTIPETRYAKSGDVHLAYQIVGDGPRDLVLVPGWVSHLEYEWEEPHFSRFLRRLASFSRLILRDR